ncbi:hypothetical protein NPIL_142081 [Nephila pilipes]|uniref:Uncharacterized protein n=1 Tax=Nephila pilipes TaxID=299642 RepID=A0A8X6Q4S8_NEPPI|nr:hypothetical protein NPIL_142081 [Nephila pilipes]
MENFRLHLTSITVAEFTRKVRVTQLEVKSKPRPSTPHLSLLDNMANMLIAITTHTRMRNGQTIPCFSPPQFSHPFSLLSQISANSGRRLSSCLSAPALQSAPLVTFPCVHRRGVGAQAVVHCTGDLFVSYRKSHKPVNATVKFSEIVYAIKTTNDACLHSSSRLLRKNPGTANCQERCEQI